MLGGELPWSARCCVDLSGGFDVVSMLTELTSQEKRYRSMQEHIRRAHPEHYIPKLPATEESFQRMINSPPSERPQPAPPVQTFASTGEYDSERIELPVADGDSTQP